MDMKEEIIRKYISKIDFNGDWSYRVIEAELGKMIGEMPAIDVQYQKDVMINEVTGTAKEVNRLHKVTIHYSDLQNENLMKRIEIIV